MWQSEICSSTDHWSAERVRITCMETIHFMTHRYEACFLHVEVKRLQDTDTDCALCFMRLTSRGNAKLWRFTHKITHQIYISAHKEVWRCAIRVIHFYHHPLGDFQWDFKRTCAHHRFFIMRKVTLPPAVERDLIPQRSTFHWSPTRTVADYLPE